MSVGAITARRTTELTGFNILLVEDDYFIAHDMARDLAMKGATIVGPVASAGAALQLIAITRSLDGAILDVNLKGEPAFQIANALRGRGVPFAFATGYCKTAIPAGYALVPCLEKPVSAKALAAALLALLR